MSGYWGVVNTGEGRSRGVFLYDVFSLRQSRAEARTDV